MGKFVGTISGIVKNAKFYGETVKFAVSYKQKEDGKYVDKWANVVLFGKSAERFKEYGGNDSVITATGTVSVTQYTRQDGTVMSSVEVIAFDFDILKRPGQPQATPAQAPRPQQNRAHASKPNQPNREPAPKNDDDGFYDDDIPF